MVTNEQITYVFTKRVNELRAAKSAYDKAGQTAQAHVVQARLDELQITLSLLADEETNSCSLLSE